MHFSIYIDLKSYTYVNFNLFNSKSLFNIHTSSYFDKGCDKIQIPNRNKN